MAHHAIMRPFREIHVGDEFGLGEHGTFARKARDRFEGRALLFQLLQLGEEGMPFAVREPGADFAGEDEFILVVIAHEQGAERARMLWLRRVAADDEFLFLDAFGFEPALTATGVIGIVRALGNDALPGKRNRPGEAPGRRSHQNDRCNGCALGGFLRSSFRRALRSSNGFSRTSSPSRNRRSKTQNWRSSFLPVLRAFCSAWNDIVPSAAICTASPSRIAFWQGRVASAAARSLNRSVHSLPLRVVSVTSPFVDPCFQPVAVKFDFVNPVASLRAAS